jgi:hypothetical protein
MNPIGSRIIPYPAATNTPAITSATTMRTYQIERDWVSMLHPRVEGPPLTIGRNSRTRKDFGG